MVAMNSIPQQVEGNSQSGALRAIPTTSFRLLRKPSLQHLLAVQLFFMFELLIVLYFELENLNHEPNKLISIQCL
jgi:hypothetical protein